MRAVNLLPRRETSSRKLVFNSELAAGIGFTVVIVVAVLGGFILERSHAGTERQQLAAAQTALDSAQGQQPSTQSSAPGQLQVPIVLSQQQPWQAALDAALATRVSWDVLLSQLEFVVPAKVILTTVTLGAAPGATGGTVALGGSAYSMHDVGVFLSTLARVPKLSQVTLVSSAANTGTNVLTFQITAQATLPAAPVAPAGSTDTTTTTGGST